VPLDNNQFRLFQRTEMKGEGGRGNAELIGNLTRSHACHPRGQERLEQIETCGLSQRRKGTGNAVAFHISGIIEMIH
jgi:hypothetical protein